jgi:hypothetical protein
VVVETPEGEPELSLDKRLYAELTARQAEARAWLEVLGHKPQNQKEADKAMNFSNAFSAIEKEAEKARKAEKDKILEAGRAVDSKWRIVVEPAGIAKKWIKGLADDYAIAENRRREEAAAAENARAQAEFLAAKKKADEDAARLPIGVEPPKAVEKPREVVADTVKIGSSGRVGAVVKREVWSINDQKSLFHYLAEKNLLPESLLEEARKFGELLSKGGATVPGMVSSIVESVR